MKKASGSDGIPGELFQILKDESQSAALNMPTNLENSVVAIRLEKVSFYSNPKERQFQIMFKLPHNCTLLTCQQSNAQNSQQYTNQHLSDVQAGFKKGRGTRDQIANIRSVIKKVREFQKNIYFCFIDYDKAFDCVNHNKLWEIHETGIPDHLTCL